ncbi:MAG: ABC transporter ATP-binding protein [Candidatus Aenigmarchaeota archaeon]|nr:ABC transporter ATP-binding protein [Candidatus Aenigmarchaeota archaeon]
MGINIKNLKFSYSEIPVLNDISLDVKDGEIVGIVGSTGSGKTTFSMCLNGIIPNMIKGSFSGDVEICGKNTKKFKVFDMAKHIGMVFQDPDSQIFSIDVKDEISFGLENMGLSKDEIKKKVENVINDLGMNDISDRETFTLSHGQKQKVCMASVLVMDPDILVLDEPTSQLDYRATKGIYDILLKLKKRKKTIIVIEHKVEWLLKYTDRILVLDKGKFVLNGSPYDVFSNPLLEKIGIEIPKTIRISNMLKKRGVKIDFKKILEV